MSVADHIQAVGIFLESFMIPFVYRTAKRDLAKLQENGGNRLPPEFRLIFAMVGAPLLTIGLFWMGWTSDVSFLRSFFKNEILILDIGEYFNLESTSGQCHGRLCHHLHLHQLLSVYHRFLRDIRGFSIGVCDAHSICCCGSGMFRF